MKLIYSLVLIVCIHPSFSQGQVIDDSFVFLDKWGLMVGYEIQYVADQKEQLDEVKKKTLFTTTRSIAASYGPELDAVDLVNKRDSIEIALATDIIKQMKDNEIAVREVNVINLLVPKAIADAIAQKARLMNESPPTRIKVLGK